MTSATVLRIYYNVNNGTKRWVDDILPIQKQMFYSVFRQKDTKQPVFEYCLYVVGIAFFSPSYRLCDPYQSFTQTKKKEACGIMIIMKI